jgi:ParB-like chromosome segregation protein Spo0J
LVVSIPFSTQQFEKKPNPKMPRTTVRLDKIVATQGKLDKAKVADIAAQAPSDIDTDPIVHPHRGRYYVTDGHHRVAGAIERGDTHIKVRRVR